jgi:diguanylate cyclase (GGDEF)-like protein
MNAFAAVLEMSSVTATEAGSVRWRQGGVGVVGVVDVGVVQWRLDDALTRLAEAEDLIVRQQERIACLESLSMSDELTGLLNRRGFYDHFRRELAAADRHPLSVGVLVMIDLDGFKAINDTHGHAAGDACLRHMGRLLAGCVRREDVVARLGGDEFAVLFTGTDAAAGAARACHMAGFMAAHSVEWQGMALPVRFSFGLQPYGPGDREEDVIRKADARMYAEKAGRKVAMRPRRA